MLTLIGTLNSPYTRKTRLMLLENKIPHKFIIDLPRDTNSQIIKYNPLKRIPVLMLEDGACVFDSPVITEYIDGMSGGNLIPNDVHERMIVKRWEAIVDGIMDAAVQVRMERERKIEQQDQPLIDKNNNAISLALRFINNELETKEFCYKNQLTLADLALVSVMIYLDLRQPERNWRKEYPHLNTWFEKVYQRESVQFSLAE